MFPRNRLFPFTAMFRKYTLGFIFFTFQSRLSKMGFPLAFLAFCTASFLAVQVGNGLSFSFPVFNGSTADAIKLFYDSYFSSVGDGGIIQLTTGRVGKEYSEGWAVYAKSVPVWDASSRGLASFTTHFRFAIEKHPNNSFGSGDGIAFFMAPVGFRAPTLSAGKWLGLFNDTTVGKPSNHIVAVEFDTEQNSHDRDDNHVGIDINTVSSVANQTVSNGSLKDGKEWNAWVDYDGKEKTIQVFLGRTGSKPAAAMLRHDMDLAEFLPENVMVGFSASTGMGTESHLLLSWEFSCTTSWKFSSIDIEGPEIGAPVRKRRKSIVAAVASGSGAAAVCGVVLVGGLLWWFVKRSERPKRQAESDMAALDKEFSQGPRKFKYAELKAATKNFSEEEKLGQGGFGSVYRGVLQDTRELVAVKRVSQGSKQGKKEYVAEVSIISRLGHRNLVQLLGWCHERGELLLVYEYMRNGGLDSRIFGDGGVPLEWGYRYNVACDVASALVYLHEDWDQCILHRDVKSSNIMLDSNFNAKLGDFGLARLVKRDTESGHMTVVAGTLGYLAPECMMTGMASMESDVYSFGTVALEIACGRRALDERCNMRLVDWVWDLYGKGRVMEAAAGELSGDFNGEEMERLLVVGLWCCHPDPAARPRMREALKVLRFEVALPDIPRTKPLTVFVCSDPVRVSDVLSTTSLYATCSQMNTTSTSFVLPR
uniref:non-specific serine/threonine protein kinase n=1 Tax=Araucaria cunninghamii TaxID=56994 RepID=A0A0D6QTB9_ARACU